MMGNSFARSAGQGDADVSDTEDPPDAESQPRIPRTMKGAWSMLHFSDTPRMDPAGETQDGNVDGTNVQQASPSVVAGDTTVTPHDLPDVVPATSDNATQDPPTAAVAIASSSGPSTRVRPLDLSGKKGKAYMARNPRSKVYRVIREIIDYRELQDGREYLVDFYPTHGSPDPDIQWVPERFVAGNVLKEYWT